LLNQSQTSTIVDNLGKNVDNFLNAVDSLDKIKVNLRNEVDRLSKVFDNSSVRYKYDSSPVTDLDLALSEFFESIAEAHYPDYNFYSEEKFEAFSFPLMALDPLDGTREFVAGRPEWAVSLGLIHDRKGFSGAGWVYNPSTGEEFSYHNGKVFESKSEIWGEVSRSEWESGLFKNCSKLNLRPMGSIAYKLGRLSSGKVDYVVSLRDKNIWDIAGGTILCEQSGYKFYERGREVTQVKATYSAPLLWCHESLFPTLANILEHA
jgi:myo-inositol-1(or 4)-monophosphatase